MSKKEKGSVSTQSIMNIESITDYSLKTPHGELVYFIIHPTNISVLSESSVNSRIYALMTVLKGIAEIEMLCLNSKENFDDNKAFLQERMEEEPNPVIRKLLQNDSQTLTECRCRWQRQESF